MSIEGQLGSLTSNEAAVLFWKCKGLKYDQIAPKLGYSLDWVQLQMSNVYKKLGFDSAMHWTKRKAILENDVCPKLPKDLKDWNFREEPKEATKEEPAPDPQMVALVLYDEQQLAQTPEIIEGKIVKPRTGLWIASGALLTAFCVLVVAGAGAYWWFHRPPPVPAPTPTAIPLASPSPNSLPSSTAAPPTTQASVATAIPPTKAPTSIPTPAFYEQGQPAILRDGVTVTLQNNFVDKNFGGCFTQNPGFVIELLIHNSTGSQFLIRFDPAAFHAQDDSGNTYTLKGAGMYICNAAGPQNYPGRSEEALYVSFAGQIPLSASYITITADSLSGVRLVFHKLL